MQINSEELKRLGVPLAAALEPCTNLKLGALVLSYHYREARAGGAAYAMCHSRMRCRATTREHPTYGLQLGMATSDEGVRGGRSAEGGVR